MYLKVWYASASHPSTDQVHTCFSLAFPLNTSRLGARDAASSAWKLASFFLTWPEIVVMSDPFLVLEKLQEDRDAKDLFGLCCGLFTCNGIYWTKSLVV